MFRFLGYNDLDITSKMVIHKPLRNFWEWQGIEPKISNKHFNSSSRKKALIIASVASMIDNFNRSNIDILLSLGYQVVIAANFHTKEDINSQDKIDEFSDEMEAKGVKCVHIEFSRRVSNVGQQLKSIKQVNKLLAHRFDLIHCHSPICSVIVRAAAQKYRKEYGCKVVYTAHGFHFYTGASLKNWMVFYPIEKFMSRYTDILITINREDYKRAKKFKAEETIYIPGVGIDTKKYKLAREYRIEKRKELGLNGNSIMLLSVGELNANKNHELAIRALALLKSKMDISKIKYYICGQGPLETHLKKMINKLNLSNTVYLMGYRRDVAEIYGAADIFIFMSKREGLPMSLMEGMASGLPCIVTRVRGNTDLVKDGKNGYIVDYKIYEVEKKIYQLIKNQKLRESMSDVSLQEVMKRDIHIVKEKMREIYQ